MSNISRHETSNGTVWYDWYSGGHKETIHLNKNGSTDCAKKIGISRKGIILSDFIEKVRDESGMENPTVEFDDWGSITIRGNRQPTEKELDLFKRKEDEYYNQNKIKLAKKEQREIAKYKKLHEKFKDRVDI